MQKDITDSRIVEQRLTEDEENTKYTKAYEGNGKQSSRQHMRDFIIAFLETCGRRGIELRHFRPSCMTTHIFSKVSSGEGCASSLEERPYTTHFLLYLQVGPQTCKALAIVMFKFKGSDTKAHGQEITGFVRSANWEKDVIGALSLYTVWMEDLEVINDKTGNWILESMDSYLQKAQAVSYPTPKNCLFSHRTETKLFLPPPCTTDDECWRSSSQTNGMERLPPHPWHWKDEFH